MLESLFTLSPSFWSGRTTHAEEFSGKCSQTSERAVRRFRTSESKPPSAVRGSLTES